MWWAQLDIAGCLIYTQHSCPSVLPVFKSSICLHSGLFQITTLPPMYTTWPSFYNTCRNFINDVISTASFSANCKLPSLSDVFNRIFKNHCLQMYATATDNEPILHLERLPSGRYWNISRRTELRRRCFRPRCVQFWNSVFLCRWSVIFSSTEHFISQPF